MTQRGIGDGERMVMPRTCPCCGAATRVVEWLDTPTVVGTTRYVPGLWECADRCHETREER